MVIYRAILNYGYQSFKLEILEYCPSDKLIETKQFYIDKFKLEYNILQIKDHLLDLNTVKPQKNSWVNWLKVVNSSKELY